MMLRRKTDPKTGKAHFARACAVEMHTGISQEPLCGKFTGEMPDAKPATPVACEPAVSKCTWTCQKRHFVRKFTGKMPDASPAASVLREPAQSKCTWRIFTGENAKRPGYHPDQAPAYIPTVRTPQCGYAVWRIKGSIQPRESAQSSFALSKFGSHAIILRREHCCVQCCV